MKELITIDVNPVPKPRMTRSDRWKKRPAVVKYYTFKDKLRSSIKDPLPPKFSVMFLVPMPSSWSAKKKQMMCNKPHQSKPDVDNYLKAFMDALCENDSYVHNVAASKYWGYTGKIVLAKESIIDPEGVIISE